MMTTMMMIDDDDDDDDDECKQKQYGFTAIICFTSRLNSTPYSSAAYTL